MGALPLGHITIKCNKAVLIGLIMMQEPQTTCIIRWVARPNVTIWINVRTLIHLLRCWSCVKVFAED